MGSNQSTVSKLDLSGKGLKDLEHDLKHPRLLPSFSRLVTINLSKNKLEKIPAFIITDLQKVPLIVEQLTTLNLSKNRFTEIPEAVFTLMHLKVLDLSDNQIWKLPDALLNFYRLEELKISHNQIALLPWRIHKLKALKSFHLGSNKIRYFPNNLGRMKHLVEFEMMPNPLDDRYTSYAGLDELMKYLIYQRAPDDYLEEAEAEYEVYEDKVKKLSQDSQTVRNLLKYTEGLDALREFSKKEFNEENLHFYETVRSFKRRYSATAEIRHTDLYKEAKAIYERFIVDKAPEQVNLPSTATKNCKKIFTDTFNFPKGINQWIFKEAFNASFVLMTNDTFQRFRVTPTGKKLIGLLKIVQEKNDLSRANIILHGRARSSSRGSDSRGSDGPIVKRERVNSTNTSRGGVQSGGSSGASSGGVPLEKGSAATTPAISSRADDKPEGKKKHSEPTSPSSTTAAGDSPAKNAEEDPQSSSRGMAIDISQVALTRTLSFTPHGDLVNSTREPLDLHDEEDKEKEKEKASDVKSPSS